MLTYGIPPDFRGDVSLSGWMLLLRRFRCVQNFLQPVGNPNKPTVVLNLKDASEPFDQSKGLLGGNIGCRDKNIYYTVLKGFPNVVT